MYSSLVLLVKHSSEAGKRMVIRAGAFEVSQTGEGVLFLSFLICLTSGELVKLSEPYFSVL